MATLATAFAYEGWIIATTINAELLEAGDQAPVEVMSLVFGRLGGSLLTVFVVVWYGNFAGWWGGFMDISELPIAILYVIYILIQVWMIRKLDYLHAFGRYVAPALSGLGSLYIIFGAVQKDMFLHFLALAVVIALVGFFLMNAKARTGAGR